MLSDNRKARVMKADGSYAMINGRGKDEFNSQEVFYQMAQDEVKENESLKEKGVFQPILRKNEL